ncbi:hypothetical protein AXG93_1762s1230 [Marchantia polymorpha subsp. ruderalis]|uniref:Uncharacterized protein n=1 Tax=Marchantia polymorpha subsp. ruderalis TaxID=1480154 RepID=A0A176WB80_MARPO|nr:hypothetical protein AXG93_1762s1230 [Marchantia polymorpha subsp. ruderalis]
MQVHMQPQQQRRSLDSSEFTIRLEDLHCGPMVGGLDWLKRLFKGADIASLLPGHNRNQHMNSEERRNMRRAKSANHAADLKQLPMLLNGRVRLSTESCDYDFEFDFNGEQNPAPCPVFFISQDTELRIDEERKGRWRESEVAAAAGLKHAISPL